MAIGYNSMKANTTGGNNRELKRTWQGHMESSRNKSLPAGRYVFTAECLVYDFFDLSYENEGAIYAQLCFFLETILLNFLNLSAG